MSYADVSVVIPCYKSSATIGRAVESVYQQTLKPKEVILVDDCSPDDTLTTLYNIKDTYPEGRIIVVPLAANVGAGSERNRGWDVATGEYIAFLDSDDSWHPQKIELQYNWMKDNPHVALSGHACTQLDANATSTLNKKYSISEVEFKKSIKPHC